MTFTKDIRGTPWAKCEACPHPKPDACPSRRIAGLCDQFAASPGSWGPVIYCMDAETSDPIDRHCVPLPPPPYVDPPPEIEGDGPTEEAPAPDPKPVNYLAWKDLVTACDYRGPGDQMACGCSELRYCLYGRGRISEGYSVGTVSIADCHACVTGKAT